jgi:arginyl-tRNA synthetase
MKQRIDDEGADWVIYVTDAGQRQHFDGLFDATRRAGWLQVRVQLGIRKRAH